MMGVDNTQIHGVIGSPQQPEPPQKKRKVILCPIPGAVKTLFDRCKIRQPADTGNPYSNHSQSRYSLQSLARSTENVEAIRT